MIGHLDWTKDAKFFEDNKNQKRYWNGGVKSLREKFNAL